MNFLLIPYWGAMGAAIATMVSYTIVWVVRAIHSRKLFAFDLKIKRNIIIYLVLGIEVILISADINPIYIVSILGTLIVGVVCKSVFIDIIKLFAQKCAKHSIV